MDAMSSSTRSQELQRLRHPDGLRLHRFGEILRRRPDISREVITPQNPELAHDANVIL